MKRFAFFCGPARKLGRIYRTGFPPAASFFQPGEERTERWRSALPFAPAIFGGSDLSLG